VCYIVGASGLLSRSRVAVESLSGRFQVLARAFGSQAGRAAQARWSRDGTQLFYITPDEKLMAIIINAETGRAGTPHQLFQTHIIATSLSGFQYDVAPDGQATVAFAYQRQSL
jgi:eukaryotic-like serine/threonine-protein kinase